MKRKVESVLKCADGKTLCSREFDQYLMDNSIYI